MEKHGLPGARRGESQRGRGNARRSRGPAFSPFIPEVIQSGCTRWKYARVAFTGESNRPRRSRFPFFHRALLLSRVSARLRSADVERRAAGGFNLLDFARWRNIASPRDVYRALRRKVCRDEEPKHSFACGIAFSRSLRDNRHAPRVLPSRPKTESTIFDKSIDRAPFWRILHSRISRRSAKLVSPLK